MRGVLRFVAVHLAGDHDADGRRLLLHGAHLHGRGVGTQQQAIALGAAFLVRDDQRVLRVARGMAGREVHRLEVVEVGFDFGADADGVAESREDRDDLIHRARNGVLGSGEAACAGQCDVDGLGCKGGVAWA